MRSMANQRAKPFGVGAGWRWVGLSMVTSEQVPCGRKYGG